MYQAGLEAYIAKVEESRKQRDAELTVDLGWLTLVGLFWLQEGENRFGTATDNDLILSGSHAPPYGGILHLDSLQADGKAVTLRVEPGVTMSVMDEPITERVLQSDASGAPDFVTFGSLTLIVIQRGNRVGIRIFDTNSPRRDAFGGLSWFPIEESYRIPGRFEPHDPPKPIQITNVLGDIHEAYSPGRVIFELNGQKHQLDAEDRGTSLFFNFRDGTNQYETYPAGRFLYADLPEDGYVTLDFNQATNPYCAYTAYATCPLPPPANHLSVRIEAGEKRFNETL
ncbi:MAG: DUF1684 domain-containing protein [Chloroflexota bacterium]